MNLLWITPLAAGLSFAASLAVADDICPGDMMDYRQDGQSYSFWFADAPQVVFRASEGCDPALECEYSVVVTDLGAVRDLWKSLPIKRICKAFSRKESNEQNPYFENDRLLGFYAQNREIIYKLKDPDVHLVIVVDQYFNGEGDETLGHWDSDTSSGAILPLGISTVEIYF